MNTLQVVLRNPYPLWQIAAGAVIVTGLVIWQYMVDAAALSGWKRGFLTSLHVIVGILVGPSVLNLIQGSELLDLLADLGLFLLMFLSGFEIDFNKLERQRLSAIGTGLLVFALTLGASHLVTQMLGYGMFMTLVLATTSVGLVVPTLRATRHSSTALGQSVLISAILADFLTLMAVAFLALIHEHGVSYDLLKFPALFIAIVFVLRCLRLAVWWYPKRFARLFVARADQVMAGKTVLFSTVPGMVKRLREHGLMLGIVSTKYRRRIEGILERERLLDSFAVIVGGEDVSQHKPDPESLLLALERLGVLPGEALYVGDSVTDAQAARRAGVPFVAVLSGTTSKEAFRDCEVYKILADVRGLGADGSLDSVWSI